MDAAPPFATVEYIFHLSHILLLQKKKGASSAASCCLQYKKERSSTLQSLAISNEVDQEVYNLIWLGLVGQPGTKGLHARGRISLLELPSCLVLFPLPPSTSFL